MAELDSKHVLQYLIETEEAAEEILADRQTIVDLDRKRQKTREATRALTKDTKNAKQWVCCGNMFLKIPTEHTKNILRNDYNQLDEEIEGIRQKLKVKVNKLRDLEKKESTKGFDLKALSKDELRAIESVL